MSKPDDIPQDVWDAASVKALEYVEWLIPAPNDGEGSEYVLAGVIARSIMAAKAEERQACIITVLSFVGYGGDTHHGITCNPMIDAMVIARALHKPTAAPSLEDAE